jgi:FKBP-type peptidyl-prolyl cis-trans isomerase FkpA
MTKSRYLPFHLCATCLLALCLSSCGGGGGGSSSNSGTTSCSSGSSAGTGSSSVTALTYVDNVVGTGAVAADGATLTVNYTGWLYNASDANNEGTEFDSGTYAFELGIGKVIPGWDQGLAGMKVGGTRTLTVPSSLAYGSCPPAGSPIPPNSALVFTVTLTNVAT